MRHSRRATSPELHAAARAAFGMPPEHKPYVRVTKTAGAYWTAEARPRKNAPDVVSVSGLGAPLVSRQLHAVLMAVAADNAMVAGAVNDNGELLAKGEP